MTSSWRRCSEPPPLYFRCILQQRSSFAPANKPSPALVSRDAGATRRNHDPATGTPWYRDLDRDEPIMMVEVVNHSAEPYGSFKRYLLRVDPRLRPIRADGSCGEPQPPTVRNAVASTFGLSGAEYAPEVET
jgi:hypothetical protein